jgi:hypothetical protein
MTTNLSWPFISNLVPCFIYRFSGNMQGVGLPLPASREASVENVNRHGHKSERTKVKGERLAIVDNMQLWPNRLPIRAALAQLDQLPF